MNKSKLSEIGLGDLIPFLTGECIWEYLERKAPFVKVRPHRSDGPVAIQAWPLSPTRYFVVETPTFMDVPVWLGEILFVDPLDDGTVVFLKMAEPLLMDHFIWTCVFRSHGSEESRAILECGGEWEMESILMHEVRVHIPVAATTAFLARWGNCLRKVSSIDEYLES